MKINYLMKKHFPALAWIAVINGSNVDIFHGCHVECNEKFFVEGAWSGDYCFADGKFSSSDWFCGTGAELTEDKILFSTSTHVKYGIYMYCENGTYYVSNTLYGLMACADIELDNEYSGYEVDFNSIRKGINSYTDTVVTKKSGKIQKVNVLFYSNLTIYDNGTHQIEQKKKAEPFKNFDNYYSRLLKAMIELRDNANDKNRNHTYGVVTTISKGYDSTACAVIARKLGSTTACTFEADGKHAEDCGDELAKKLGFKNIIVRNQNFYKNNTRFIEAEVVCSGELGSDITMSSFDDVFKGNVVLTGERGDSIWNKNAKNANSYFCFDSRDASLGNSEKRLWVDYISCPMPLFEATAWESIHEISTSSEMNPWSLNNNYDRPIPRRIVEEAGIERNEFGIRKHGAGFSFSYDWKSRIFSRMSKNTADDFKLFLKKNKKCHFLSSVLYYFKVRKVYFERIGLYKKPLADYSEVKNPTVVRYLVPWAGGKIISRYSEALNSKE